MKRIQNIIMGLWIIIILLFALFNWDLLWREEPITLLFVEFMMPWAFWAAILALALPLLFRWIGAAETRVHDRRAEKEIAELKAKAFDQRGEELENLVQRIQSGIESTVRGLLAEKNPSREGSETEPGSGDKSKSGAKKK